MYMTMLSNKSFKLLSLSLWIKLNIPEGRMSSNFLVKFPEFEPKERPKRESQTELSPVASRNLVTQPPTRVAEWSKSSVRLSV